MDISYRVEGSKFNYRVCAMIIADGKMLSMHDERSPYFYPLFLKEEIYHLPENLTLRTEYE